MLCLLGDEVAVYVLLIGGHNPRAHMFDLYEGLREREPKASPSLFSKNMFDLYEGLTERAKGLSQPLQQEYV